MLCSFYTRATRRAGGGRQQLARQGLRGHVRLCLQCTTTPATTASLCARTASASPSTLCVTTTVTVPMAPMSPPSVVSLGPWHWETGPALVMMGGAEATSLTHCLLPQSTQPAAPTSSAVPTDAV